MWFLSLGIVSAALVVGSEVVFIGCGMRGSLAGGGDFHNIFFSRRGGQIFCLRFTEIPNPHSGARGCCNWQWGWGREQPHFFEKNTVSGADTPPWTGACGNVVNYATDQLYQVSLETIAEQSAKVCLNDEEVNPMRNKYFCFLLFAFPPLQSVFASVSFSSLVWVLAFCHRGGLVSSRREEG